MAQVEIRNLSKRFGTLTALNDVSLSLESGQCMGLIGPNGSGKSTLLKCIAGAQLPTSGKIILDGRDVTRMTPAERSRAGLSLKFQITSIFPKLTVYDNLLLAFQASGSMRALLLTSTASALRAAIEATLARYFLAERRHDLAGALSHGQQQWLEIAMTMSRKPAVLLLDEPTAGMSPQERRATGDLFMELKASSSLLIVEHDLDFIRDVSDQLSVLDQGELIACGPLAEVQNDKRVREAYLSHG
jgi:branched-chain amino acid transport system ATP-binding protein